MEEILHHLGWLKPYESLDKPHVNSGFLPSYCMSKYARATGSTCHSPGGQRCRRHGCNNSGAIPGRVCLALGRIGFVAYSYLQKKMKRNLNHHFRCGISQLLFWNLVVTISYLWGYMVIIDSMDWIKGKSRGNHRFSH